MGNLTKEMPKAVGRPKGSRNKITLLKLMAEESVRSKNVDRMLEVCEKIIEDALNGDRDCRKLVWQSIMSKSGTDQNQTSGAVPEIVIRSDKPPEVHVNAPKGGEDARVIEGEIVEEITNERPEAEQ